MKKTRAGGDAADPNAPAPAVTWKSFAVGVGVFGFLWFVASSQQATPEAVIARQQNEQRRARAGAR